MPSPPHQPRPFTHAVRVVAFFTAISRFGGLIRDVATARIFGSTPLNSAFAFAFLLPSITRRLVGAGALAAAFIPEYASLDQHDPQRAPRFASLALALVAIASTALTLLAEAAILAALLLLPRDPERTTTLALTALMLPYIPLVCASAILGAMLQVHHRFGPSAASPVILNTAILATVAAAYFLLDLSPSATAYAVAAAIVLSGIAQVAWCASILRAHTAWTRDFSPAADNARRAARNFLPTLLGLGSLHINTAADGAIASVPLLLGPTILGFTYPLDDLSSGLLSATQRLYQFPLGVFGIAVATAVFPALSRAAPADPRAFTDLLRRGLRLSLFISLPASAGLLLVGEDLARILFKSQHFTEAAVVRCGALITGYATAVWAYSANQVLARACFAKGDTRAPMRTAIACAALNIALNLALVWVPAIGETALAWSTAIAAIAQAAMLAAAARAHTDDAALLDREARRAIIAIAACAGAMTAAVALTLALLPHTPAAEPSAARSALRLAAALAVGLASYAALALAARRPEPRWLLRPSAHEPADPSR